MPYNETEPARQLREKIRAISPVTDEDWSLLTPHLTLRSVKKKQVFAREGKKSGEVAFIAQGLFRQYYTVDGEEKTTYFFSKGIFSAPISVVFRANHLW